MIWPIGVRIRTRLGRSVVTIPLDSISHYPGTQCVIHSLMTTTHGTGIESGANFSGVSGVSGLSGDSAGPRWFSNYGHAYDRAIPCSFDNRQGFRCRFSGEWFTDHAGTYGAYTKGVR